MSDRSGSGRAEVRRCAERGRCLARAAWWLTVTAAFVAFAVVGRVSTYRSATERGEERVLDIWRALAHDLPQVSVSGLMPAVYVASLAAFIGGGLLTLWLALAAEDRQEQPDAGETASSVALTPAVERAERR